jgi:PKD repeat protein
LEVNLGTGTRLVNLAIREMKRATKEQERQERERIRRSKQLERERIRQEKEELRLQEQFEKEPLVANFSSSLTEGEAPFTLQFSNYSVGEIISYEWDFDNDGTIDSYEQNPEFTYQDTGYYSVKLIIHDQDGTDEFLREDFIHVTDGSGIDNYEIEITNYELNNYPNPFNPHTTINYELPDGKVRSEIFIYNIRGQLIETLPIDNTKTSVKWEPKDCSSGIYFYKINIEKTHSKKMILLK